MLLHSAPLSQTLSHLNYEVQVALEHVLVQISKQDADGARLVHAHDQGQVVSPSLCNGMEHLVRGQVKQGLGVTGRPLHLPKHAALGVVSAAQADA